MVVLAIGEPDGGQPLAGAPAALARRQARVEQGQLDVFQRAGARQEIEHLEHEPDLRVPHAGQLVAPEAGDVTAVEPVAAGGRGVEAAEQVHERRLAGAGGPHDGDELAGIDRHRDPAQGVHHVGPEHVVLCEPLGRDDRVGVHRRPA